jgi:pimeloyl-ACP methyl ester carboxylesterase
MDRTLHFRCGTQELAGTLTVPDGPGPHPGALLVPGSGPVDRDSNHAKLPIGVTRELAEALADSGFATFRYDKRGVGESPGDWLAAGLGDNIDDASAALTALRAQPEVDGDRVVAVGHSEGALIVAALAARQEVPAGVALISGSATPGAELLQWQARKVGPSLPVPVRVLLRLMGTNVLKQVTENHRKIRATTTDVARIGGRKINAKWTREFLAHDPATDLARITVPVLAVTGAKDLQVDPADLDRIARLVRRQVETHEVPDVNHILRTQPGTPTIRTYRKDATRPVDQRVLDLVTDWARRVTAPQA